MAKRIGMTQSMVSRVWRAFGLKPHRHETFKLASDPAFIDKVCNGVGLPMPNPHHLSGPKPSAPSWPASDGSANEFPTWTMSVLEEAEVAIQHGQQGPLV